MIFISEPSQSREENCIIAAICIICIGLMMYVLGLVSSLSFCSLSAMAWSSLLRPLFGTWSTLLFVWPPCARDFDDWFCCFASYAATRLSRNDSFLFNHGVPVYLKRAWYWLFVVFRRRPSSSCVGGFPTETNYIGKQKQATQTI